MMKVLSTIADDFLSLFFPRTCLACSQSLFAKEEMVCTYCKVALPKTNMHRENENVLRKRLVESPDLELVASFLHFRRRGRVQKIIHHLKYGNKPQLGHLMGKWYAADLKKDVNLPQNTIFVPIPLHPEKLHRRGYNQAAEFAQGLADGFESLHLPHLIHRKKHTETQTRKSRQERFSNVEDIFEINQDYFSQAFQKPIVVVDDVITTGATIQSAIDALKKLEPSSVSVLSLTMAG